MADDNYEVGYRRPPKHSRFKPGQSGNPAGKKRGRKAPRELLDQLLAETVWVTEHDQRRRVSKLELVLRQLVNKAAAGNPRLMRMLLDLIERQPETQTAPELDREDEAIIADLVASLNTGAVRDDA